MMDRQRRNDRLWAREPEAEAVLAAFLDDALAGNAPAAAFAGRLLEDTAIRLRDILDHITLAEAAAAAGFERAGWSPAEAGVWRNAAGLFPPLVLGDRTTVWLRVEDVATFLEANRITAPIEGVPGNPLRRAIAFRGGSTDVGVVERSGHAGFDVPEVPQDLLRLARIHFNALRVRRREFDTVEAGLAHTEALVDAAIADLGPHWACDLWLKAEREFWMKRCASGRFQKQRQDAAGVGWCNIDHHTYDSSRRHFRHTIRILEKLGYELREMLYAGELAGWGSQVLEQPVIGSTIFADVDLAPEELTIDFAHEVLPDLPRHRRAGLLSELLGESILEAGLNHVAGLYDNVALRGQLTAAGIAFMTPFSDFAHLYQELTCGDMAPVDPRRVDALEAAGHIGAEEAEKLRLEGSIVTHLENIERNDGFKGFNREGIDSVLRKLDPRAYHGEGITEAVAGAIS
ncbi:hypothetical protein ACLBKU_14465 [Erythrobacter sp. NE805]|uniref:hypothetical protein n=1 Tax=Erythrobacter sp. NE805 TaxID=3389875 RepID=UPI00396B29B7